MSHSLRCSASRPPLLRPQQGRAQEGCHHTPHSLSVSSPKEDTGQAQGFREQQVVMGPTRTARNLLQNRIRSPGPRAKHLGQSNEASRASTPGLPCATVSGFSGGPEASPVRTPLKFPQQSSRLPSCLTYFGKKWTQGPLGSGGPMMNWPRPQHKTANQNQLTLCQVPWVTAFMASAAGRGPKAGLHDIGITGAEIRPLSSRTYDKHHHEPHLSWARQTGINFTDKLLKTLSRGPSSSSSYGPGTFAHLLPHLLRTRSRKKPFPPPSPGGSCLKTHVVQQETPPSGPRGRAGIQALYMVTRVPACHERVPHGETRAPVPLWVTVGDSGAGWAAPHPGFMVPTPRFLPRSSLPLMQVQPPPSTPPLTQSLQHKAGKLGGQDGAVKPSRHTHFAAFALRGRPQLCPLKEHGAAPGPQASQLPGCQHRPRGGREGDGKRRG